jgi:6,7-dimethyl-8-ribityllumazine synthase
VSGIPTATSTIVKVPGSWEIPFVAERLAGSGKVDAVIGLGVLIRGATSHFDYIAAETAKGLAQVGLSKGIPVSFGVLTCDTLEQALECCLDESPRHHPVETVRIACVNVFIEVATLDGADLNAVSQGVVAVKNKPGQDTRSSFCK